MIEYFRGALKRIKIHAAKEFPDECCGLIVNNSYIRCKNISNDKESTFKMNPECIIKAENKGEIQAVIHSHNQRYLHASKMDMDRQMRGNIPWGIINVDKGNPKDIAYFGDSLPMQDYIGRPFRHGIYDCYSLVRDYYRKELGIIIPIHPREYGFWKKDDKAFENLVMEGLDNAGFKIISTDLNDLQLHDGILAKVNSSITNHTAIYIGKGLLLHHLCLHSNSLSNNVPINVYRNNIEYIVRHKKLC